MAESFRLIRAWGESDHRDLFDGSADHLHSSLDVEFSHSSNYAPQQPWVSVVIGKNGIGKSRLLAGIVNLFETIEYGRIRSKSDVHSVSGLTYLLDGCMCNVSVDSDSRLHATVDGVRRELADLPLPTKIIALTTTPFDKFRISRSLLKMPGRDENDVPERYTYLGLRDRTGRASPTAAIFRALEGLFEASRSESGRRLRIAEVFRFLGYKPRVEARYEISPFNGDRLKLIANELPAGAFVKKGSTYQRPFERMLERDPLVIEEMRDVAREALDRASGERTFKLLAEFEHDSEDDIFFRRLQLLRRADLVRMRSVEIQRIGDGAVLDLRLASSGELGIATGFLGLASVIEDGSLVFIDEPEISLHPEWQTRYLDLLLKVFEGVTGCHFVLATHSPMILSDVASDNSNLVSLDPTRLEAENTDDFAGQSVDHVLVTAFRMPGKNNLYLKQEIIKALRLAADGRATTKEFSDIVGSLVNLLPEMAETNPVAKLIRELQATQKLSESTQ